MGREATKQIKLFRDSKCYLNIAPNICEHKRKRPLRTEGIVVKKFRYVYGHLLNDNKDSEICRAWITYLNIEDFPIFKQIVVDFQTKNVTMVNKI